MINQYIFNRLTGMIHQAFLDENMDRNLPWYGSIPYSFLSEEWKSYEERAVKYVLNEMLNLGMIKEEFENMLGDINGKS